MVYDIASISEMSRRGVYKAVLAEQRRNCAGETLASSDPQPPTAAQPQNDHETEPLRRLTVLVA